VRLWYIVLMWYGFALIACLAGCGASDSLAGLLVGRFFLGVSGCMFFSPPFPFSFQVSRLNYVVFNWLTRNSIILLNRRRRDQ
jgi:hypothetical protein